MKTANNKARRHVQELRPFKGSHLYAEMIGGIYVVFSYGPHWPLFIYRDGKWLENKDRYSQSTGRHRSQAHPLTETVKLPTFEMIRFVHEAERGE